MIYLPKKFVVKLIPMFFCLTYVTGCATLWPFGKSETVGAQTEDGTEIEQIKKAVESLSKENSENKKLLAASQMELQSLREQLATAKRNIQVLNRAERSGIYYDDEKKSENLISKSTPQTPVPTANSIDIPQSEKPALKEPQDEVGRSGFSEESDENSAPDEVTAPANLLSSAQQKYARAQFGEAIVSLNEMQSKFPNYDDKGEALLMLAESWLQLREFSNALAPLRKFYLKYPNSSETFRAKTAEAEALEGLGMNGRAVKIYQEIIATGPQTPFAQKARTALIRLREKR